MDDTLIEKAVITVGEVMPTPSSRSVQNVRIITEKTIEKQGAVTLKDVLSKELNIRIDNDMAIGSSLSLQGITGQNIKILLDGVPLIGRENGNINLDQVNLANISRIEIIEGPLSVIYGTDALGGIINLVSKKITSDKKVAAHAKAYYETIGQYNFGGGGTVKIGSTDFQASIFRNFFDGYNPEKNTRTMLWKPKQQVFGSFALLNDIGKLSLRFKTDIFNEKIEDKGKPVINHLEGYATDAYYFTNRVINALSLDYKKDNKSYWNLLSSFSFYQRDKLTYRKNLVTTEKVLLNNNEATGSTSFMGFMTRGYYSQRFGSKLNTQVGLDINFNSAFGSKIASDKGNINDYAIFSCIEYKPIYSLTIKPAFRAAYNSRFKAPFIPSIQIQYMPNKNINLRYAYGKGFRAPDLKELYLNFVDYNHNISGNSILKAELSHNHNLAFRYRFKLFNKYRVTIDNNYFYNKIFNQITLVSTSIDSLKYSYQNINYFKSHGVLLNLQATIKSWSMGIGASYIGTYNNIFEQAGEKNYIYSPELKANLAKSFTDRKKVSTTFSVFYKYNGRIVGYYKNAAGLVSPSITESFKILDATLSRPFMKNKLNITVGCKNILNLISVFSTGNSNAFHSGSSSTMLLSPGRSYFIQANFTL